MLYVILSTPAVQVLVDLSRTFPAVYAVRMKVRAERSNKAVLLTQLALAARVTEYVMPLNSILTGIHTMIHVIREDAP